MFALLLCKSILWVFLGGITINGNAVSVNKNCAFNCSHRMKFRQFLLRMSAMLSDSELRGMNHVYHYSTSRYQICNCFFYFCVHTIPS